MVRCPWLHFVYELSNVVQFFEKFSSVANQLLTFPAVALVREESEVMEAVVDLDLPEVHFSNQLKFGNY